MKEKLEKNWRPILSSIEQITLKLWK